MTKERNMATFKVGDRVRLTDEGLAHWGDQASGTTGTVTPESDEDGWVYVEWGNGRTECYRPSFDITLADPSPPGPRYVVRAASEMQPDDMVALRLTSGDLERRDMTRWIETAASGKYAPKRWGTDTAWFTHAIVDTRPDSPAPVAPKPSKSVLDARAPLAPDVLADAEDGPPPAPGRLLKSTPIKTAPVEPPRPSDAEVCRAYAEFQRADEQHCKMHMLTGGELKLCIGNVLMTLDEVRAAWSRELRRLRDEAADRERLRVVVQCQDGGADDV